MCEPSIHADSISSLRDDIDVRETLFRLYVSASSYDILILSAHTHNDQFLKTPCIACQPQLSYSESLHLRDALSMFAKVLKMRGNHVNGCWTKLKN
jgi:hypothetical protein